MKKLVLLCTIALIAMVSCTKADDQSIVGEWSGVSEIEAQVNPYSVSVHYIFKKDGTYEELIPHWIEKRYGTYTVKGDQISFTVTKLEWLWMSDRHSGYEDVYDMYGCKYQGDIWDNPRQKYADPQAQWEKTHPEEAAYVVKYNIDKDGIMTMESVSGAAPGFGKLLVFIKNPGYKVPQDI